MVSGRALLAPRWATWAGRTQETCLVQAGEMKRIEAGGRQCSRNRCHVPQETVSLADPLRLAFVRISQAAETRARRYHGLRPPTRRTTADMATARQTAQPGTMALIVVPMGGLRRRRRYRETGIMVAQLRCLTVSPQAMVCSGA